MLRTAATIPGALRRGTHRASVNYPQRTAAAPGRSSPTDLLSRKLLTVIGLFVHGHQDNAFTPSREPGPTRKTHPASTLGGVNHIENNRTTLEHLRSSR